MLKLFAAKNTVALAPFIALEETGLPFEVSWVNFANNEQRAPSYLAINPKGRVPALISEHGIVTEAPAILEYIAELSGQLMPTDIYKRTKVRELMGYLAATMHPHHAHGVRGERWSDDASAHASMRAKVPQTMADCCAYVETCLPASGWLVGEYSIADIHLYNVCRWLEDDGVDITNYPKLAAHFQAMSARPAVVRVCAANG